MLVRLPSDDGRGVSTFFLGIFGGPRLTMPIRPAPWVSWVHEAEGSDVSPPGILRHACVLIGCTTTLYTRQLQGTLRPPLCRLQKLPIYSTAD